MTNKNELTEVLSACKVCRIGLSDAEGMMIFPMNFGYTFESDQLVLYFHSGNDGRKIRALLQNPSVCFEMDGDCGLIVRGNGETACDYGYRFCSAMGTGKVFFAENLEEKKKGLSLLALHQSGKHVPVTASNLDCVTVFKLIVKSVSIRHHGK